MSGRWTELAAWAAANAVRADDLGPCDVCGRVVHPLEECSECLEEEGVVVHEACCPEAGQ
jgi:hypothetical protein